MSSKEKTLYIGKFEVEKTEEREDGKIDVTLKDFTGKNPVAMTEDLFNKISDEEQVEQLDNIGDLVIASATQDILEILKDDDHDLTINQIQQVGRSLVNSMENKKNIFIMDSFGVGHPNLVKLTDIDEALDELK